MRLLTRCRHYLETTADRIESGKYFYLYCLLMLFLSVAGLRAKSKALWYDELFTFHLSHLPSMAAIWVGQKQVADVNPPDRKSVV